MKRLYRKGTVHPSPSPPSPSSSSNSDDHPFSLSYLPAAILTLAVALSAGDREVLAYLLSASSASTAAFDFDPSKPPHHRKKSNHHSPSFNCPCFTCYTSYWARWDSSPNRHLIHEIIDAFEEGLLSQRKKKQGLSRREKRKSNKAVGSTNLHEIGSNNESDGSGQVNPELGRPESVEESGGQLGNGGGDDDDDDETGEKQGSVRKLVSFIGERIWGTVWG